MVNRSVVHTFNSLSKSLMKCDPTNSAKLVQVQKNANDVSGNNLFDWLHFFASTVVLRISLFKNLVKPLSLSGHCKKTVTIHRQQ